MTRPTPPPPPAPGRARLTGALRELRARTGLSMAGLAAKTTYSKSSWERYLNGRTLPPREAVRELCRLAGEDGGRCLALWEIAESECSGRAAQEPRTETGPGADRPGASRPGEGRPEAAGPRADGPGAAPVPRGAAPRAHRGLTAVAVLASVSAVAAGSVAAALFLLPRPDGGPRAAAPPSAAATAPRCRGEACEGEDPMRMKCGVGPRTLTTYRTATGAELELRYSAACRSGWARMWRTRIGDRLEVTAAGRGGGVRGVEIEDAVDARSFVYTPMTAARPGTVVRVCFRPAAGGGRECFDGRVR
ncbi:DUF2690 domain-containing protein [Streptomyces sp. NPDC085946]|uniref:DUF2690 domain-containing protein n=1 Tax=Streptomyces sp. NPDC085946 TaxID=3365744 RepID=UPI0037D322B9